MSLLAEGGAHTPAQLARQLGVSEGLLEHMLADLVRMGYLRSAASSLCQAAPNAYSTPCAACSRLGACAGGGRVWALTEKRAVEAARRLPKSAFENCQ